MLKKSLYGLLLMVLCSNVAALEWAAGADFGGDTLVALPLVGGGNADINAGDGLYFKLGTSMPLTSDGNTELVGMLGLKYWGVTVTSSWGDGSVDFTRYPLDVMVRHTMEQHSFAAGLVKDLSVSLSCSGVVSCANASMESQLGYTLQYTYVLSNKLHLGVRYTSIKYDLTDLNETVDGSTTGFVVSRKF